MRTVLLALLSCALASAAERPVRVLVTAFAPFADRAVNGSATLAAALETDPPAGFELEVLTMPVTWGRPAAEAGPLIVDWKPDLVLGLGEGAPGYVALETRAVNRRRGRDVEGREPPAARIDADGPAARSARLAFALTPGAELPFPVVISRDAGRYLCNEALYTCLGTGVERVGFVHLPPQGDTEDATYVDRYRPFIEGLIRQNLPDAPDADATP